MPSHERTVVYEEKDVSYSQGFQVTPEGHGVFVDGPGELVELLLITDSEDFGIRVENGVTAVVDENYSFLREWSDELETVSAFEEDGDTHVVSVTDVNFMERISAKVRVSRDVHFDWIRAVYNITNADSTGP